MSRTKKPQATPSEDRVGRLADDLTSLFIGEGFLHLTTEKIARRLRCSKTTLYGLAPTRTQIYQTVVKRFLAGVRAEGIRRAAEADDWYGALTGLLGAGVSGAHGVSWEFVRDLRRHPATQRLLAAHQRQRVQDLERLLQEGARHGAFHDLHARLVAELLQTLIWRVFEPDLLSSVGLSLEEAYSEAYRIVEFGLVPRPGARAESGNGRNGTTNRSAARAARPWDLWASTTAPVKAKRGQAPR